MDDAPRSSRLFVTRKLPWILAVIAAAIYLATLNPWLGAASLRPVVEASRWSFETPFSQPLHSLLGLLVGLSSDAGFPRQMNLLTALMAAAVVYLLARSVALLPHDRRHEERLREHSDIGLLTIATAWAPPVLAVALLAFQWTFWRHATAYTGEMLDLLLFAYCIRGLLEFRLDRTESRLWRVAFAVGIGIAANHAMIGFAPLFLVSLAWIRGWGFFNLGFLVRLAGFFLLGASVMMLIPALAAGGGRFDDGFWPLMKAALVLKKNALLGLPRGRFLFFGLLMIAPLGAIGIRWSSPTGTGFDRLATAVVWQLLLLGWFVAGIAVAFDARFSPRVMGYGLPLLTFSYCASLAAGYICGYYLLLAGVEPDSYEGRPKGFRRLLHKLAGVVAMLAVFAVPVGLVAKNYRTIRAENSTAMRDYAMTMIAPLPAGPSVVFSEDNSLSMLLIAGDHLLGSTNGRVMVSSRLAPTGDYRNYMAARHGGHWPSLRAISEARDNVAGLWLTLAVNAATNSRAFFSAPIFSFFAEPFDFRPAGASYRAVNRRGVLPSRPEPAELEQVRRFWGEVMPAVESVVREVDTGASNAVIVATLWSRTANASGVFFQESGLLAEAGESFDLALRLQPANAAAKANRAVNTALRAGRMAPPEAVKLWDRQPGLLDAYGPVDEPEFLRIFGETLLAQGDGLVRRAAVGFDRATRLSPTNHYARFGLVNAAVLLGDLALASNAVADLRDSHARGGWLEVERASLRLAEARLQIAAGENREAAANLLEARRLNPLLAEAHDFLSYLHLLTGNIDEALSTTDEWIRALPGDAAAKSRRALILLQTGKYGPAAETLSGILESSPDNKLARLNRAIARLMLNQLAEAKADYQRLLKDRAESFQVHFGLAEVARREKQPAAELGHLERYVELAPKATAEYTNVVSRIAALRSGR